MTAAHPPEASGTGFPQTMPGRVAGAITLRATMLGGVSALALACVLIPAGPARADVSISTSVTGPVAGDNAAFMVTGTGTISGGATGIVAQTPGQNITTLSNSGTVSGANWAVGVSGTIGTLINNNAMSGYRGIFNAGGTISNLTNNAAGTIVGNKSGISNAGAIGTLSNSGTLSASGDFGIHNTGSIDTLTNNAGGLISGAT